MTGLPHGDEQDGRHNLGSGKIKPPAAARNLISPFPVSPSGGKPGRAGSPHAATRSAPANTAGTARARGSPRKRGFAPLAHPPNRRLARLQSLNNEKTAENYNLLYALDQRHECADGNDHPFDARGEKGLQMAATSALTFTTFS
jgi:hypothetical protein